MRRAVALMAVGMAGAACSGGGPAWADNVLLPHGSEAVSNAAMAHEAGAIAVRTVPGLSVGAVERKERDGRVYWDVAGTRPDGNAVEVDVLERAGALIPVEIQRDIAWSKVPARVRRAAAPPFTPARVIESRQVEDDALIFALFAPGRPDAPAIEVRLADGEAIVLKQRWAH